MVDAKLFDEAATRHQLAFWDQLTEPHPDLDLLHVLAGQINTV